MITQNPITGRSRKKLAGVYARTLWGLNVIQSCPKPSTVPPTPALKDSRAAFALVMQMANMVSQSLLFNIFYAAPVGRSRRHVLSSQLFTGVQRNADGIRFNAEAITQLGSNPVVTTSGILFQVPAKTFSIPVASFNATQLADTSQCPCVFAISYDLGICVPLLSYTTLNSDNIDFSNISDTLLGQNVLLLPLWPTNVGSVQYPIWAFGAFRAEQ